MSVLAFLRQHQREGGHHLEMQPVQLVVEALRVRVAFRFENGHGVIGVLLLVRRDGSEDLAETPRRNVRHAGVARERRRIPA